MIYTDDKVELLNISINNMIRDVQKRCAPYNIHVDAKKEEIRRFINKAVEVDVEAAKENERCQRTVIRRKNGAGVYISVKNIRIFPTFFLDGLLDIVANEFRPIIIMSFLLSLLKQLTIDINKKELLFYSIIYAETKRKVLTDENLLEIIKLHMTLYGYDEPQRDEVYEIIGHLLDIEMLSVTNGRYFANERFYL
ncbi:MAG: hypothetical protein K2N80_12955 [Lachnospiraceae bacterium]|nr:hypothetical protein [Lachnospiraceae bacterium]